jgi:hypothetical protein
MANKEEVLQMLDAIDGGTYNRRDLLKVYKSMVDALGFAPAPAPAPEPTPEPEPADESEVDDDGPNFSND